MEKRVTRRKDREGEIAVRTRGQIGGRERESESQRASERDAHIGHQVDDLGANRESLQRDLGGGDRSEEDTVGDRQG